MLQVGGMRIYTSGDVEAVNGTDVRLKCTFQTSSPINPSALMISWSFRPLKPGREESVREHACLKEDCEVGVCFESLKGPALTEQENLLQAGARTRRQCLLLYSSEGRGLPLNICR